MMLFQLNGSQEPKVVRNVSRLGRAKPNASMYTNSRAWAGVRNKNDMMVLSRERRQWLGAAVRAAAYLISSIGAGPQAKDSEYGKLEFVNVQVLTRSKPQFP